MKKQLVLFLALALCLGLTACGDTESDDTQSGYETVMDMEFLDGMWSIDGTSRLYFDSEEGFYACLLYTSQCINFPFGFIFLFHTFGAFSKLFIDIYVF